MEFLNKLFKKQKEYLNTDEHFRAFSPNPEADFYQLVHGGDNVAAITMLKNESISLLHVSSGSELNLSDAANSNIIFVTAWEPYSAQSIGAIKRKIDSNEINNCKFVFFEDDAETIKNNKHNSWYYDCAYVLATNSKKLKELICQVPLTVVIDNNGKVKSTATCVIL